jgi:hypothetical protein
MTGNTIGNFVTGILLVALVATLVGHKNTASDVSAAGTSFANVINAAQGAGIKPGS